MTALLDKVSIFIILLLLGITSNLMTISVLPILLVICFVCLLSYFDSTYLKIVIFITYLICCYFSHDLLLFIPLICYEFVLTKYQFICFFALIPILMIADNIVFLMIILLFFVIDLLLKYKTEQIEKQKSEYIDYQDKSRELSFHLEQKNDALLAKQDYEINIATLNERTRIAREIHDNVGHLLSSSILQTGAIRTINKDPMIQTHLDTLNSTLNEAMDSIRESVHDLHDTSLKLEPQVKSLVEHFEFCDIALDYEIIHDPNTKITYSLIAIIKESLSNIIKHSNATNVSVILREHPAIYQLVIKDNGTNIDRNINQTGIGLKNMEQRIYELNGHINITINKGFQVFISIPKEEK